MGIFDFLKPKAKPHIPHKFFGDLEFEESTGEWIGKVTLSLVFADNPVGIYIEAPLTGPDSSHKNAFNAFCERENDDEFWSPIWTALFNEWKDMFDDFDEDAQREQIETFGIVDSVGALQKILRLCSLHLTNIPGNYELRFSYIEVVWADVSIFVDIEGWQFLGTCLVD